MAWTALVVNIVGLLPLSSVLSQQLVSILRSPTASFVVGKIRRRSGIPSGLDRGDNTPGSFDLIGALKQRCISHHAIMQKTLIAGAGRVPKIVFIIKVHVDRANLQDRSRDLGAKAHSDSFVG